MSIEAGLLSLFYNICKDVYRLVLGKDTFEQIIANKQKWKRELDEHLRWIDDAVGFGGAIIRDVKRADDYPNLDAEAKGISPWFRTGLLGLYHRGLQVGLSYEELKFDENFKAWRLSNYKNGEEKDISAVLIGRIPFEAIVEIDWGGDEYYYVPHIYCKFVYRKGEPYEEVVFAKKVNPGTPFSRPFYTELCNYDDVMKLSKKLKTGRFAY